MKSGWLTILVAAGVGGVVGACVVMLCGHFFSSTPNSFDKLQVKELVVSERILLWQDGKEDADLLIENGGILARNRIVATHLSGNALFGNAFFTTPDDPTKHLEECTIFTEMLSRPNEGGLMIVRSPDGGKVLANPNGVSQGMAYAVKFDENKNPISFILKNETRQAEVIFGIQPQVAHAQPSPPTGGTPVAPQGTGNIPQPQEQPVSSAMTPPMIQIPVR